MVDDGLCTVNDDNKLELTRHNKRMQWKKERNISF